MQAGSVWKDERPRKETVGVTGGAERVVAWTPGGAKRRAPERAAIRPASPSSVDGPDGGGEAGPLAPGLSCGPKGKNTAHVKLCG